MSAAAELKPFLFDDNDDRNLDLQFEAQHFRPVTPYSDDLDDEYQAAQDKLRELRQQEEQVRRQAAELEELTKKEQLFKAGRAEVSEELTRCLAILVREGTEAQRRVEECGAAHERLETHLANLNSLRPEMWARADRKAELSRALGFIEAAEDEIDQLAPLLEVGTAKGGFFKGKLPSMPRAGEDRGDFLYWLKSGFAFSLPFVGFAVIALIAFLFF